MKRNSHVNGSKTQIIWCPKCGRKQFTADEYDGHPTLGSTEIKCSKCKRLTLYFLCNYNIYILDDDFLNNEKKMNRLDNEIKSAILDILKSNCQCSVALKRELETLEVL